MAKKRKNPFLSWIAKGYKKDQVWIPWVNIPIQEDKKEVPLALEWTVENKPMSTPPYNPTTPIKPKVFSATADNPVVDKDKVLGWEVDNTPYDFDKFIKNKNRYKSLTKEEQDLFKDEADRIKYSGQWVKGYYDSQSGNIQTAPTTEDTIKPLSQQTDRDIARIEETKQRQLKESADIATQDTEREVLRIRERGERAKETLQRSLSLRGVGRSSLATDKIWDMQSDIDSMVSTAERKYQLEQELRDAQIRGVAGEQIQGLQDSLAQAKNVLAQQLQENLEKQQEVNAEMNKGFAESIEEMFEMIQLAEEEETKQKIDINKTKELSVWYFTDSQWNIVADKTGKPIIYKAPQEVLQASKSPAYQFVDTKIDNVTGTIVQSAGYFNRFTGEFKPINFGWDTMQQEFQWVSDMWTQTKIAEYTNIYKWSPYNAEWIDLAWKKWSAIKTPITWEVIYAEQNWQWGNQVKIRDVDWQVHQFSHLEDVIVQPWQKLTPWSMIGTMWNSWNVVWWNGEKLTPEQIKQWRWTHLDYTVYDTTGKKMPLSVAMSYAWIPNTSWNTSNTTEAVEKWYDTATKLKIYNKIISEWWIPPNLKAQKLNEWQRKSVWFAKRMGNDLDIMKTYYKDLKWTPTLTLAWYRRAFGTTLWNSTIPPTIQQFLQAERDFIQAKLREESGAAIPASEIEAFIQTNGILPWDSDEVIQQKFKNMEIMLEGMIITSWPWKDLIDSQNINDNTLFDKEDEAFFWNNNTETENIEIELDGEDESFFNNL
mgnify:CR=1 FL=1